MELRARDERTVLIGIATYGEREQRNITRKTASTAAYGKHRREEGCAEALLENDSKTKNQKRILNRMYGARATSEPPFITVLIGIATCDPLHSCAANQPAQSGKKKTKSLP